VRLLLSIARFELRQQLRSHVFWIVFAISFLMVAGALNVEALRVGISAERGAALIVRTHLVWSLFYMFTAAAFAGDAVLRDEASGFDPIMRAAPVRPRERLLGRFLGSYAATALCFLSVPAALLIWSGLGADLRLVGIIGYALVVLALPNLLVSLAVFFALAAAVRSLIGAMLGAVALLALYGVGQGGGSGLTLAEPFGFAAWAEAASGWSDAGSATELPEVKGVLLANRLLWAGISLTLVAAMATVSGKPRPKRIRVASPEQVPASAPHARPLPNPVHGPSTAIRQFAARTAFELRQTLFSPWFTILLLLGLGNAAATIWQLLSTNPAAGPDAIVAALIDAFDLVPIVVAIFFAGELVWSEREHRIQDLVGAAPLPNAALFIPKLVALALALVSLALAGMSAALAVPPVLGQAAPSFSDLLAWYVVPRSFDWILIGILALFFQALAPNKLAGWGLMVLYLIGSLALEQIGYRDPLYRYGTYPGYPLPEALSSASGTDVYRLYWGAFALLLATLAVTFLSRSGEHALPTRLRLATRSLKGPTGLAAAAFLLAFLLTGLMFSNAFSGIVTPA